MSGNAQPELPTYLFLQQEELLTSFDAGCLSPIQQTWHLHPGLTMLQVEAELISRMGEVDSDACRKDVIAAAQMLLKESRKRPAGKRGGDVMSDDNNDSLEKKLRLLVDM